MVCPGVPESIRQTREDYLRLADLFNDVGAVCHQAGMKFGYHNHHSEFEVFDGEQGIDLIFAHTDPQFVQMELDVFWVEKAGAIER